MSLFAPAHLRRARSRLGERGQALVVSALIMLLVTVAVFLTFAIGNRVREKTKLQALADSSAYSLAVAEARAMNFYAFSNRAIVAHYVSILSIHSHESYINWYEQMLSDTSKNYGSMVPILYGICACSKAPCSQFTPCGCICKPCSTACSAPGKAKQIRDMYKNDTGGYKWLHQKWHQSDRFHKELAAASSAHLGVARALRLQQTAVHATLNGYLLNQSIGQSLARVVDDKIQAPAAAGFVSQGYYADAVTSEASKHDDFDEILVGTRYPAWLTKRGFKPGGYWGILAGKAEMKAMPDITVSTVSNAGNSKTVHEASDRNTLASEIHAGNHRDFHVGYMGAGAEDHGKVRSTYEPLVCPCFATWSRSQGVGRAAAYSDPYEPPHHAGHGFDVLEGDERDEKRLHDLGGCTMKPNGTWTCGIWEGYMRYKLSPERDAELWNMPRTFALLTKDMSGRNVWDFNFSTEIPRPLSFTTTNSGGDAKAGGKMAAMAGGLVYFHKPPGYTDDYKEPPNLWNPYWRAKLHPIRNADALRGLGAGHSASATALGGAGNEALNY